MYNYKEWYDFTEAQDILNNFEGKKWRFNEEVRFSVIRAIWKAPSSPWTSDKVIRLLNWTENYKSDPLYKLAWEWIENRAKWPKWSNLYNFYKTIQVKIKNRSLSEYNELYNDETKTINNDIIDKYCQLQVKYWKIWFNNLSIWDFLWSLPNNKNIIIDAHFKRKIITISSWEKTIIESLNFLEEKYEEVKTMYNEWINTDFLWLYLSNPDFITVIDWVNNLWELWKEVNYSYINSEYCLRIKDSWNKLIVWNTLAEMIENYNKNWFENI